MLIRLADAHGKADVRLDSMTTNFGHAKHCALLLLERAKYSPTAKVMNSDGEIGTGEC